MSLLVKAGITNLSELEIDVSKDWLSYLIKNIGAAVDDNDAVRKVQAILQAVMTTHGDIIYRGDSVAERLAPSDAGKYLQTKGEGEDPVWSDVGGAIPERFIWPPTLSVPIPTIGVPTVAEDHSGGGHVADKTLAVPIPIIGKAAELSWLLIDDCEAAWDEYVQANVTSTADNTDKKVGTYSAKMDVGVDAAVGRLATVAITSKDLSPYKYLKAWVKSSINLGADDLDIMLDDSPLCVTPLKELAIPALTAGTWTQITLDMGDTSGLTAIISIGIGMNLDKGAFIFHIDQVRATKGQ